MTARLDEAELRGWGERLGRRATREGVFVALYGPLGSGKSTLVRAAARATGVEGAVQSPTYTLVHEHPLPGGGTFFHVDLYRIEGPGELDGLGWDRLLAADGPVFLEWADRAAGRLPEERWEIRLEIPADRSRRLAEAQARGGAPAVPSPGERVEPC